MDSSDEASTAISSTYEWLCANPLASSCGSTICSFYNGSKNLNSVTSMTAGYLEGAVTYMTEKAKPVTAMLSEKFEKPISYVDSTIFEGLTKLEEKYPTIGKAPFEVVKDGKEAVSVALQHGRECFVSSRGGQILGVGAGYTLSAMEMLVEKVLPPTDCDYDKEVVEEVFQDSKEGVVCTDRIYNLSCNVYYRSLMKCASLHQQVCTSLQKLKDSLNLLQAFQNVSSQIGTRKENFVSAVHKTDTKLRLYLSEKFHEKDFKSSSKNLFHESLEYAKSTSKSVLNVLQRFIPTTKYMPIWLRDGINNAIEQVQAIYTTLALNNVPSELPSFLLSQFVEIVEAQLVFTKNVGLYITSLLKTRFPSIGLSDTDTSSEGVSEVCLDEVDEEEKRKT